MPFNTKESLSRGSGLQTDLQHSVWRNTGFGQAAILSDDEFDDNEEITTPNTIREASRSSRQSNTSFQMGSSTNARSWERDEQSSLRAASRPVTQDNQVFQNSVSPQNDLSLQNRSSAPLGPSPASAPRTPIRMTSRKRFGMSGGESLSVEDRSYTEQPNTFTANEKLIGDDNQLTPGALRASLSPSQQKERQNVVEDVETRNPDTQVDLSGRGSPERGKRNRQDDSPQYKSLHHVESSKVPEILKSGDPELKRYTHLPNRSSPLRNEIKRASSPLSHAQSIIDKFKNSELLLPKAREDNLEKIDSTLMEVEADLTHLSDDDEDFSDSDNQSDSDSFSNNLYVDEDEQLEEVEGFVTIEDEPFKETAGLRPAENDIAQEKDVVLPPANELLSSHDDLLHVDEDVMPEAVILKELDDYVIPANKVSSESDKFVIRENAPDRVLQFDAGNESEINDNPAMDVDEVDESQSSDEESAQADLTHNAINLPDLQDLEDLPVGDGSPKQRAPRYIRDGSPKQRAPRKSLQRSKLPAKYGCKQPVRVPRYQDWSVEQWDKLQKLIDSDIPNSIITNNPIVLRELKCKNKQELALRVEFLTKLKHQ